MFSFLRDRHSRFEVTAPSLSSVKAAGAGDVSVADWITGDELALRLSGPGEFLGSGFEARTAGITITGTGDARVSVEKVLKARLTGGGNPQLTGGKPEIDTKTTGRGRVL